jgi:predicted enzyme related to lactoylglutathione lyase
VVHTTETDKDGMVQTKGAINGGFYKKTDDPLSQAPSVVVSVEDVNEAVKAVKAGGGEILGAMMPDGSHSMEPQMIPGVGMWVSARDTEGNRFSILQPGR